MKQNGTSSTSGWALAFSTTKNYKGHVNQVLASTDVSCYDCQNGMIETHYFIGDGSGRERCDIQDPLGACHLVTHIHLEAQHSAVVLCKLFPKPGSDQLIHDRYHNLNIRPSSGASFLSQILFHAPSIPFSPVIPSPQLNFIFSSTPASVTHFPQA